MRNFTKILALLLPFALLLGCGQSLDIEEEELSPSQAAESSAEEELPITLPEQLSLSYYPQQSLDPITCPDGVQQTVAALLCEGLFELDESFLPKLRLCSAYTCDPTYSTYVFTLRPGALFSDGSAVTAGDVVDTLRRAKTSTRYSARLRDVAAITAGDGGTVTISLSSGNAALPALLDIPIVKSGTADTSPVGTGAYYLTAGENGGARLAANPNWQGGKQPVDSISLLAAETPDIVLAQFASHETQLLASDLTGLDPVSVTGRIAFYDADATIFQYVGLNVNSAALSGAALRQALNLGLDREQIASAFLSGHGKAAQFPIAPAAAEYPAALETAYSYDAFQKAMTAAGYNTGEKTTALTMIVNEESGFKVSIARYIAATLSAFDLKIEVSVLPWSEYAAALSAGKFDLYYGEVKLSADWDFRALLATGGSLNYGGNADPVLDTMIAAAMASTDRPAALATACRRIQSTAPILPVCFKTVSVLAQEGVFEGLAPTASNPFFKLADCTVNLKTGD